MKKKGLDLGKGPIFPLLLKMSWPSIIAMLAVALANLIDAFWLARLSTEALAALTTCFPIQMIFELNFSICYNGRLGIVIKRKIQCSFIFLVKLFSRVHDCSF